MTDLASDEVAWDNTDDFASGGETGVSHRTHQSDFSAAENEGNVARGKVSANLPGGGPIGWV